MIPPLAIRERGPILLGADTATLSDADNKVGLIKAEFTPGDLLVPGEITPATFTGSTFKVIGSATITESLDPNNGDVLLDVPPPIGGWRWETSDTVGLPQTIFGFWLTNNDENVVLGAELLAAPIILTGANQSVVLNRVGFRFVAGSIV